MPESLRLSYEDDAGKTGLINGIVSKNIHGVYINSNRLFIGDGNNNRILIFDNIIATPQLDINPNPEGILGGRLNLEGNIILGESDNYVMQWVKVSVNDGGFGDVTSLDSGREDGVGKTRYEFNHEFSPWVNTSDINKDNWREDMGYTLKVKASSLNADQSTLFLFKPFKLLSTTSSSVKFSVPQNHIQQIKNEIDHFEVWSENQRIGENIPTSLIDENGVVETIFPVLSREIKIVAVSKDSNWKQDSNTLTTTSTSNPTTLVSTSSSPLQINNLNGNIVSSFNLAGIKSSYTLNTTTPIYKGIAYANSKVTMSVTNNLTKQTKNYTVTVNPDSSFTITPTIFPNSTINIYLIDPGGGYVFLPGFKLSLL